MANFLHHLSHPPSGVIFTQNLTNPSPRLANKKEPFLDTDGFSATSLKFWKNNGQSAIGRLGPISNANLG